MEQSPKQTMPSTEQVIIEPGDPAEGNPFVTGPGMPARLENADFSMSDAAQRAQSFDNQDEASTSKKWSTTEKVVTGIAASAALVSGGLAIADSFAPPEFSQSTTEYVVQPGDGIYDAAEQINGVGTIDIRDAVEHISTDPANIDTLKDGLQPGETVVIPTEVQQ